MIGDPQRLQYLEAMGISAWVSRYRFVNARPTEQGEWQLPDKPEKAAPGQRLQALLETPVDTSSGAASIESTRGRDSMPVARARALLDGDAAEVAESARPQREPSPEPDGATAPEPASTAPPLRFTLSLAVLDKRWWLLLPGEPLSSAAQKLLRKLLGAAGLPTQWTPLATLSWPLMETPVTDPAGEAREGIQVFCAGQALRNALTIDGAIVIGGDEPWASLLNDADGYGFACHYWPHPETLLTSAKAKRDCWPLLQASGNAWRESATAASLSD